MGRAYDTITDPMRRLIADSRVFFVATAPSDASGHVNVSPKGYDSFVVLSETEVAYLDLTGSGVETIAHVRDNGRITFMFCAFEGPPNIVRLYGTARVVLPGEAEWNALRDRFTLATQARSVIVATIERTSTSCGYAVPFMDFVEERDRLREWTDAKTGDELYRYHEERNATSIDGLPGL